MAEPGAPEEPLFKAAVATGPDWGLVAKNCLDALGEPPAGANFGLLYATGALASDLGSIVTFLRETTGIEHWCGTVGLGVAANGIEYHDQPALALLAAALPADSFNVFGDLIVAMVVLRSPMSLRMIGFVGFDSGKDYFLRSGCWQTN